MILKFQTSDVSRAQAFHVVLDREGTTWDEAGMLYYEACKLELKSHL